MATTIILEAIAKVNADPAQKSINTLEQELEFLKERFKDLAVGDKEFEKIGNRIRDVQSELKTLDERFEGLGVEQKGAAIVDSFNVIAGAVGAVTGTLVALGVESEQLENVEKRLLGLITVVSSLREVSNGLAGAQKTLIPLFGKVGTAIKAAFASNPIGVITLAVTALTAAIVALVNAQDDEAESLEELNKKRAEGEERLQGQEEATLRLLKARGATEIELAKEELRIAKDREERAQKEFFRQSAISRFGEAIDKARADREDAIVARKEKQKALDDAIAKAAVDNTNKTKEATEKADKAAEDLAKRAVKQLEDERQATEDLINLYTELYPEKVTGGQFEFNTELDKTNFALQEQLDVLYSLNTAYEDLSGELETFTENYSETFFSQDQLDVFKRLRDANKTNLEKQLEDLDLAYRDDLALFSDNEQMKLQITEQYEKDKNKIRREFAIQNAQEVLGITSNFLNNIAQINQASLELQLLQAAGNQAAIDQINEKAFEQQKKLRIAQTVITTAESILNAFNATSNIPPPFGQIVGGILAASYAALGVKTIQTINSTQYGGAAGSISSTGGGLSGISLQGGNVANIGGPQFGGLPGLGGGRVAGTPSIGTIAAEPVRAYVLTGDIENGLGATAALNARRRLSSG
jgi:hypothetical protein